MPKSRKRRKAHVGADWSGPKTRPTGVFRIFANVKLFYILGAIIIGLSLLPIGLNAFNDNSSSQGGKFVRQGTPTASASPTAAPTTTVRQFDAPPPMSIDPNVTYVATIHTSKGAIKVQLNAKEAPNAVNAFKFLVEQGYYRSGMPFYYVKHDVSAVTGDPFTTVGTGSAGFAIPADPATDTSEPAGTLVLTISEDRSGQFYFRYGDAPGSPETTPIGTVIEGMDVLRQLSERALNDPSAAEPDVVTGIEITTAS